MTREEAITVLKAFMKNPLFSEVHKAAFNIAIHDIKAYQDWNINNLILVNKDNYEPTTKNDLGVDCISRAEAIKCLECDFDITGKENMKTVVNYINSAHDKIVNLPRVKQEPETGHWINRGKQGEVLPFYMRYECSMCGETADKSNYCPNCGAKMAETEGT